MGHPCRGQAGVVGTPFLPLSFQSMQPTSAFLGNGEGDKNAEGNALMSTPRLSLAWFPRAQNRGMVWLGDLKADLVPNIHIPSQHPT